MVMSRDLTRRTDAPAVGVSAKRPALRTWMLGAMSATLVLALVATVATVDRDSGEDLFRLARAIGMDLVRLRWQFAAMVAILAGCHYLATAIAARAAAGLPLPLGETMLVQLAAAAANRITPAGLGGSALTARYFTRRGLDGGGSLGAVSALAVLGSIADFGVLCVLVLLGRLLGLGGGAQEVHAILASIRSLLGPVRSPVLWAAVVIAVLVAASFAMSRSRSPLVVLRRVWAPVGRLVQCPRRLIALILSSGATTLMLAFAFVATIAMVPGQHPDAAIGALLVGFMIASAAGSSVPVPAGFGSTEAALVAVLVGVDQTTAHAVQVVLIFRLLTFWIPAAIGVFAMRALRRRAAI